MANSIQCNDDVLLINGELVRCGSCGTGSIDKAYSKNGKCSREAKLRQTQFACFDCISKWSVTEVCTTTGCKQARFRCYDGGRRHLSLLAVRRTTNSSKAPGGVLASLEEVLPSGPRELAEQLKNPETRQKILSEMEPKDLSVLMVSIETMRKKNEEKALESLRKKRKLYESSLQKIDVTIAAREAKLQRLSSNIDNEGIDAEVINLTTEEVEKAKVPEDDESFNLRIVEN